jgi:hypothetical protein
MKRILLAVIVGVVALAGCSSTKVVTMDKSVVYDGHLYNVANVKVMAPTTEAVISPTETKSLDGMTKDQFNELLKQHKPLTVRQVIALDQAQLVYQTKSVKSWSDLQKMQDQFKSAQKKLAKFMADKSAMQLQLK